MASESTVRYWKRLGGISGEKVSPFTRPSSIDISQVFIIIKY